MDIKTKQSESNIGKNKTIKVLQLIIMIIILVVVLSEFINIIYSFDINKFRLYSHKLNTVNLSVIVLLGIISYLPLSLYDFVLKKRVNIKLENKKLYKYSWIASSIASIAGFGGSTALVLKSYFYKDYVEDKKLLVKEISKIIALNLTGFSMVCLIYVIMNIKNLSISNLKAVGIILISLYLPILCINLIFNYINGNEKNKKDVIDALKIMLISAFEWITTINLIYGILIILGVKISITQMFPIFVVSIVAAIISMSPGGLGSFDLTLMLGLQSLNIPGEKVLLVLFLYRVSYYIIPILISGILFAHELYIKLESKIQKGITVISSKIAYRTISILVFLSGALLLIHSAIPDIVDKVSVLRDCSHVFVLGSGELLILNEEAILVGFLLLSVSMLISYKSRQVFKSTLLLVVFAIIVGLIKKAGLITMIYLVSLALILLVSKPQFYRESFIMKWEKLVKDIFILGAFLVFYIVVRHNSVYWNLNGYSESVFSFSLIGFLLAMVYLVITYYLNKCNDFPKVKLKDAQYDVQNILEKYKGSPMIHYIYLDDKFVYLNEDKDVLMQYQICSDKVFILGNPIGNKCKIKKSLQDINRLADKYGYTPVFCGIDKTLIPYLHESGYEFMKLGEEARVNLKDFTLEGRKMKSVRNAIKRVTREDYTFEIINPPFKEDIINDLKKVSDEWLGERKEKNFFIGSFKIDYLNREPIAVVKNKNNEIKGFSNLMPMYDNETLSIDLMRFSSNACNGIMDFMFVNLFEYAKENGYSKFNMGLAPLSEVGNSKYSCKIEKLGGYMYTYGEKVHSFQGLKKFKEKYCEEWDGLYIAYRKQSSIIPILLQSMLLFSR